MLLHQTDVGVVGTDTAPRRTIWAVWATDYPRNGLDGYDPTHREAYALVLLTDDREQARRAANALLHDRGAPNAVSYRNVRDVPPTTRRFWTYQEIDESPAR